MKPCPPEMTLAEVLADPLVRAVMAADRVDPKRLAEQLDDLGRRVARRAH